MRNLLIVFFVICFLMMVVFFPFKTRLMGHLNLVDLKCFYSLKAWIIKLLSGSVIFESGKFELYNEDTILSKSYNNDYTKLVGKEILSSIDIKKLEIFFVGGFKENSFSSAIMCGSVMSFVETLFGFLSLKFNDVKMYKDIKPTFDDNNLELTMDIVVSVSLWKLLMCFLSAGKKLNKLKELKNER